MSLTFLTFGICNCAKLHGKRELSLLNENKVDNHDKITLYNVIINILENERRNISQRCDSWNMVTEIEHC